MSVEIENETEYGFGFDIEELIDSVVEECLNREECPYEASVAVTFTDNIGIKELNRQHRNMDNPTDVLSFPLIEFGQAGDFSILEEESYAFCFEPDSGELLLGDIVISVEKAEEQAELYGHSLRREIGFLTAHSMFHLFGYDHMEDEERRIMENKQEEVLSALGITR